VWVLRQGLVVRASRVVPLSLVKEAVSESGPVFARIVERHRLPRRCLRLGKSRLQPQRDAKRAPVVCASRENRQRLADRGFGLGSLVAEQLQHPQPSPRPMLLRSLHEQMSAGLLGGIHHSEPDQILDASDSATVICCHDLSSLCGLANGSDTAMMRILTIETTCDETAAAVVTDELQVLSSLVASQDQLHQRFAGVVPEIAARAHVERILPVIDEALSQANTTLFE